MNAIENIPTGQRFVIFKKKPSTEMPGFLVLIQNALLIKYFL